MRRGSLASWGYGSGFAQSIVAIKLWLGESRSIRPLPRTFQKSAEIAKAHLRRSLDAASPYTPLRGALSFNCQPCNTPSEPSYNPVFAAPRPDKPHGWVWPMSWSPLRRWNFYEVLSLRSPAVYSPLRLACRFSVHGQSCSRLPSWPMISPLSDGGSVFWSRRHLHSCGGGEDQPVASSTSTGWQESEMGWSAMWAHSWIGSQIFLGPALPIKNSIILKAWSCLAVEVAVGDQCKIWES